MARPPFSTAALYTEGPAVGRPYREQQLKETVRLIARLRREVRPIRERAFAADYSSVGAYRRSLVPLRRRYLEMLGWPLTETGRERAAGPPGRRVPKARAKYVARDRLGTIHRLWIEALPGLRTYGLLFLPPAGRGSALLTAGRVPLVVCQHGGLGTPEIVTGLLPSENYSHLGRRILARGVAVFAPQFLLWREQLGPKVNRERLDTQLRQLGGSVAALEIYELMRCLDYLVTRPEIDAARIGMAGLSYGGFYTLYAAAAETRIKAALSSCFFSDRERYGAPDWTWFGASRRFLDAEVAALICPRPLYIEAGKRDRHFDYRAARPEARKVRRVYARLGLPDLFRYHQMGGGHVFDRGNAGIDFLMRHLGVEG